MSQEILETGDALKELGIATTLAAEHQQWKADVRAAVMRMPIGERFTSADLQRLVGREPHHPNCWGAILNTMARARLCAGTGKYVKHDRPSCHAAVIQVWMKSQ